MELRVSFTAIDKTREQFLVEDIKSMLSTLALTSTVKVLDEDAEQ